MLHAHVQRLVLWVKPRVSSHVNVAGNPQVTVTASSSMEDDGEEAGGMFIPQSFGVTDGWALTKRQKAQESIEKAVKQRVGGEYDGEQRGYRAWHRAIYGQFKRAGLEGLEENVALATTGTAPVTLEDWDKFYSSSDRQFCYDCVLGTTKPSAHAQLQRTDENGMNRRDGHY